MRNRIIIALIVCLMTGCLFGCSNREVVEELRDGKQVSSGQDSNEQRKKQINGKYSIEVTDYKEIIRKCPEAAKAGDEVTVKTNCFMDAIPIINVNGNDIGKWNNIKTEYVFVMPDEDVIITTKLNSAGNL